MRQKRLSKKNPKINNPKQVIALFIEERLYQQFLKATINELGYTVYIPLRKKLKVEEMSKVSILLVDETFAEKYLDAILKFREKNSGNYWPILLILNHKSHIQSWLDRGCDDIFWLWNSASEAETVKAIKEDAGKKSDKNSETITKIKQQLAIRLRVLSSFQLKEQELRQSENKYRQLIEYSPYGIVVEQNGQIIFANTSMAKMLGAQYSDALVGMKLQEITPKKYVSKVQAWLKALDSKQNAIGLMEEKFLRLDGGIIEAEVVLCPLDYKNTLAAQIIIHDITWRKDAERKLEFLAYRDPLTELPNRIMLENSIKQAIAFAERHRNAVAIMFLDLDDFKKVNDSLGHQQGDFLLQEISKRLLKCMRKTDIVARLGGDEFVLVITDLPTISKKETAALMAQKVLDIFINPINLNGQEIFITTSIGISVYPEDGEDGLELLKNADIAMYYAKELGRNDFRFCSSGLIKKVKKKNTLEKLLRNAIKNNEFKLWYQPKLSLETGKVSGVEALIRWYHDIGKIIPPSEFITLAEETGLIEPITEWVLKAACTQCRKWNTTFSKTHPKLSIAVNLSVRNFKEVNFYEIVQKILKQTKLAPECLELEITESLLIQDIGNTILFLQEFKKMGVQISVDDFGTGYSSLSYLRRFDIDKIKIDKSFIHDLISESNDAAITTAIINMAHSLNMKVVAEGVETEEQFQFLKQNHCDEIQGYYFCEPVPPEKMTLFLKNTLS